MISLAVYNKARTKIPNIIFRKLLKNAFVSLISEKRVHKTKQYFVELSLVGDQAMTALNRRFHNKNRPTDVISLSYFSEKNEDNFTGEIFIDIPYAKRQAGKIGQSLHEELQFLFVHGLLHIFGYDHKKLTEEKHMKWLIYRILGRI